MRTKEDRAYPFTSLSRLYTSGRGHQCGRGGGDGDELNVPRVAIMSQVALLSLSLCKF